MMAEPRLPGWRNPGGGGMRSRGSSPERPAYRLGVLGTLVWDRITDLDGGRPPVEDWGGISYAMEALSVALPEGWVMRPLLRIGQDLADAALEYLATIPRAELDPGVRVVPYSNHRVNLLYRTDSDRTETLSGTVPPWSWEELGSLTREVDALYINFITGMEMGIDVARELGSRAEVPIYADLHSLFLGLSADGGRFPRKPLEGEEWFSPFHAVQMNEDEFRLMLGPGEDAWKLAAGRVGPDLRLMAVTRGEAGVRCVAAPDFSPDPVSWTDRRGHGVGRDPSRASTLSLQGSPTSGDPTGCGDVWGATFFARLLGGDALETAMDRANRLAARAVEHRGGRGLRHHLGEVPGP